MSKQTEEDYKNKDFTDYFMLFINSGREKEFFPAFKKLVDDAKLVEDIFPELFESETILTAEADEDEYKYLDFYEAIEEEYINKQISFKAIVRGEAEKPYIYPIKIRVNCDMTRGDKCKFCGLFLTGGHVEIELTNFNPLELIDCNEFAKISLIKQKVGIMQCSQFKIDVLEQKYIQELFLSPVVEGTRNLINPEEDEKKEQRFIVRHAFCEGASIIPNKVYRFFCVPVPSPKNQSLVYYVKKYKEEESNLDKFKLTEQDKEDLKIFQPKDDDYNSIGEKLKEIYHDFSVNLSPIIKNRDDLMFACDLAFHSVLYYWLGGSFENGWVECLLVGDTSTGKTKVTEKLMYHYRLGVMQGLENSTIAGLIGGMTKYEGANLMTWGLLPCNDSRLAILDEMSGISEKFFSELTRIRGEGIAERTIVGGSSTTRARLRLVWLSNPRKRAMHLYDSGCDMIKELVGKEEDVSRFDFIITVGSDEISSESINTLETLGGKNKLTKHIYTSDLCNKLVLWAWSRKANNIVFEEDAEKMILHYSIEMSKEYTPNFPLVLGSTIRLKLAKLSIALAVRLFSMKDDNVYVTINHITYIYEFLRKTYNKSSFGYGEYSKYYKAGEDQKEDSKDDVLSFIHNYCDDTKNFILNMLTNPRITALEIRDFSRCGKERADELRIKLVSNGFLIKKAGFYVKADIFRKLLRQELNKIEKEDA